MSMFAMVMSMMAVWIRLNLVVVIVSSVNRWVVVMMMAAMSSLNSGIVFHLHKYSDDV
jgi:hypothetical protein